VRSKYRHSRVSPLLAVVLSALCTVGLGVVTATGASADPGTDAKDASRRAARAEAILENATVLARSAARRLEIATAALPAAQKKVATSRGLVVAAQVAAGTAQRAATTAQIGYDAVADRFQQAQDRVERARDRIDEIAAASYMGGNFETLNVLVGATGPQDAMDRLDLVDQVMQKQQSSVDEMTAARLQARIEQDQSGLLKRAAETTARAARNKLAVAKAAQAAAVQAEAAVVTLANARARAYAVAQSQRVTVLARYREARIEEARIEAGLRSFQHKGGVVSSMSAGSRLLMPVQGAWKSSDFGERYDPYFRVWQLHAGSDFAADRGTPIRAAAAGRVVRAGWNGGYGNYTCLDHGSYQGDEFNTCYGHQSAILVHVGEHVRRGEIIGRVGTTGASTGNHLHFETRFNGVPKNPLPYLPSCLC
jgi:murein DD-endopeptidase MepM/ murein hydrolase activator NlpD